MTLSKGSSDAPIFYDQSGRRWEETKLVITLLAVCLIVFLVWITPQILANRRVVFFQGSESFASSTRAPFTTSPPAPIVLADELSKRNTPIIGDGPLVRVISVKKLNGQNVATDPFTGHVINKLSEQDLVYLDNDTYAIQRYGQTNNKRIALTFDDGPDPLYTPQLLDMLSRESVSASFFVTGNNVVKYPDIARRLVREGHVIANHTFSHINFNFSGPFEGEQEINQTERVIAAATHHRTSFFRPPYGGDTDQSLRNSLTAILTAQKLGLVNTSYNFDSNDWQFPSGLKPTFPVLDGSDKVVLVHDSGGDRSRTVAFVKELISRAKQKGYTFANLNALYPQAAALSAPDTPTTADDTSFFVAWTTLVLPHTVITGLFFFSLASIILVTTVNIILAIIQHKRIHYKRKPRNYNPKTTIVVPAYNESAVLASGVRSLTRSSYKNTEIIIVDDGSTDNTWGIAQRLTKKYSNVTALHQPNGGKAQAINNAIRHAKGSIIIGVDADTIFSPQTVTNLVRHFKDPKVGAVAGVVKVGNIKGILTLWQALEYTLSISIERNAHALLGSIMIVPGACGAWRKSAIVQAGGLSRSTLAEDCDLTLKIQRLRKYKILQDNHAISYTEAPLKVKSLVKQRFRWTFGNIQALWKHRRMMMNEHYRILGMFIMPYAVVSIIIPLLFWPLLTIVAVQNILSGNYIVILAYFVVTLTLQFIVAAIGLRLGHAPIYYLAAVPFARFIYGPIRIYVLYKTVVIALRGSSVSWNKLARTGTVNYQHSTRQLAHN
jgi:cellulose synthase/poly-beta-1,6-N-acetylglucosamine synthase-like glycosyltransferase/peptidoglycan/xylan/chitin deacetylase (PgdA/CDA1 family)